MDPQKQDLAGLRKDLRPRGANAPLSIGVRLRNQVERVPLLEAQGTFACSSEQNWAAHS